MTTITKELIGRHYWTAPNGVKKLKITFKNFDFAVCHETNGTSFTWLDSDGAAYSAGGNFEGSLGTGNNIDSSVPVAVAGGRKYFFLSGYSQDNRAAIERGTYALYAWGGYNGSGMLGDGTLVTKSSPVAVIGGKQWWLIQGGNTFHALERFTGRGYAWGGNYDGEAGTNSPFGTRSSPVVMVGPSAWATISGKYGHRMGIERNTGLLWTWGSSQDGALGDGSYGFGFGQSSPIQIMGAKKWIHACGGQYAMYAIDENYQLYTWGEDFSQYGILADTVFTRSTPLAVVPGKKFRYVMEGGSTVYGIDTDNNMWAWGSNTMGALGSGSATPAKVSSPVLVTGNKKWDWVYPQRYSVIAKEHGTNQLYFWGWDLSDIASGVGGTTAKYSSPVLLFNGRSLLMEATDKSYFVDVVPGQTYLIDPYWHRFGNNCIAQPAFPSDRAIIEWNEA